MKKILLLVISLFLSLNLTAQVDRSIQPVGGPTPKIKLDKPKEFKLKNGITVMVVENHKLPRINYSLRFDRKPIVEGDKAGVLAILGAMLGNGTENMPKDEFNDEVDFLGASVNVSFGSASAFTLTKNNLKVLDLFSDAIINPLLVEEEFEKERDKLIEGLKTQEKSIDAISERVANALAFGKDHAYGEFITEETLNNISFQDVLDYKNKYMIPNNVYLVVIGDVYYKDIKSLIKEKFSSWEKGKSITQEDPQLTDNVEMTEINFVDLPNATQSAIGVTNNVDLKMSDPDYFAALMANDILGGGGEGYLFKNLREDKGYTYGAYSSLGSSRYGVSSFLAGAKVRNAVTDSAVIEILKEITRIKTQNVDAELLKNAKAKYVGSFIRRSENPSTIAGYALNIKLNNLDSNFYGDYLENINNVSIEDVKRAANKYYNYPNGSRIVIVGKGSDVVAALEENVGWPIKYFDKYANSIAKPVFNKPIPDGLTAINVIENYIEKIGGRKLLEGVLTIEMKEDVPLEGAPVAPEATMSQMLPNLYTQKIEMNMGGGQRMTIQKSTFNGERGYNEVQGQRIDFTDKEISKAKSVKGIFKELYYNAENLELISINQINYEDAYKVKVTDDGEVSYRYYSVETGYLLSTEDVDENNNISTVFFSDYRSVNSIMFPFKMVIPKSAQMPFDLEFNFKSIEPNKPLKTSSF